MWSCQNCKQPVRTNQPVPVSLCSNVKMNTIRLLEEINRITKVHVRIRHEAINGKATKRTKTKHRCVLCLEMRHSKHQV